MSNVWQSCHNWTLRVEYNVLIETFVSEKNLFLNPCLQSLSAKFPQFGDKINGRNDKTAFYGSAKVFRQNIFRKTHFSCQLWTLGWKQWHPEKNYRQGCWRCTLYVQGNDFKIFSFSRSNFHFSILLRLLDFRLFAAGKRFFFFGEVFATRLLKVYSRCSEEHFREKKLIFCEKLIIFAVFRLRKLLNFFLRHFLFFQRISEIWWKFFSRVPKIAFYQTRGLFLGRPFFVKTESVFGNWQNKLQL